MSEGLSEYGHGDFLIRNIIGIDSETGTLAVGELVRPGQVMQFHLRDASASTDTRRLVTTEPAVVSATVTS